MLQREETFLGVERMVTIQVDKTIGRGELREMDRTHQRQCLEELGLLRRRPVRDINEDLEENKEKQETRSRWRFYRNVRMGD